MSVRGATRLISAAAAAAAVAVLMAGCGSSGVALDPVAQAAEVTSHAGGAHMSLAAQIDAGGLSVTMSGEGFFNYMAQEGMLTLSVSGLPAAAGAPAPGSLRMQELFKSSTVYIGSPLFAGKLPGGAHWMKLDLGRLGDAFGVSLQQLAGGQSNPAQFLEYLRASGGAVTAVGHEPVRGVPTTHYRGTVDLAKVAGVMPSANRAQLRAALAKLIAQSGIKSLPVDVWVDGHGLVRRMTLVLSSPAGGLKLQMHMTLELFDFGATPPVAPPAPGDTYDATQAALAGAGLAGG